MNHENAIWKLAKRRDVVARAACAQIEPLVMEASVDGIRAADRAMDRIPDRDEPAIVVVPALCAGPVASTERCGFVKKEQFGVPMWLQKRPA